MRLNSFHMFKSHLTYFCQFLMSLAIFDFSPHQLKIKSLYFSVTSHPEYSTQFFFSQFVHFLVTFLYTFTMIDHHNSSPYALVPFCYPPSITHTLVIIGYLPQTQLLFLLLHIFSITSCRTWP